MEHQRIDESVTARSGTEWLKTEEAALLLGVSAIVMARWRMEGRGPAFSRPSPRFVRYSRAEIDRWLAEATAHSTAEAVARKRPARNVG